MVRIRRIVIMMGVFFLLLAKPVLAENAKAADGLKEALNVGIRTAVKLVGAEDGYFKNPDIKILLPEKLKKADKIIRNLGGDAISDALVLKMNRAAEKAAPEAQEIFIRNIREMNIDDAMKILTGGNDAATEYLRRSSGDALKSAFYPIVRDSLREVNALKTYDEYLGRLNTGNVGKAASLLNATGVTKSGPLAAIGDIKFDINRYVTDKAIDGLFTTLAAEEKNIRQNPEARVSDLLRDVFSNISGK